MRKWNKRYLKKACKTGISSLMMVALLVGCTGCSGIQWSNDADADVIEQSGTQGDEKNTGDGTSEANQESLQTDNKDLTSNEEAWGKVFKEETVYATLKSDGRTDKIIVSNWLKNSANAGVVSDMSSLKDIVNTKGDETFTQNKEELSWETSNEDIYYQGTSQEKLPVGISIEYELDGKKVKPADIVGKSGKLVMRIQYSNSSKSNVKINDKSEKIFTPFVMITGMILPVEKFTNVTIDHGQIVSEGDNDIVVAYGMPGLKESLALDDLELSKDIDLDTDKINEKLTDTVEITADVKDFSMGSTYTVASSELFKNMDITNVEDAEDIQDKMDEIIDASTKLVNGSKDLKDGLNTLNNNFKDYSNAIDTVNEGVKTLDEGAKELKKGTTKYSKGVDTLLNGVNRYTRGASQLGKGVKQYIGGVDTMVDGINTLDKSTSQLPKQYSTFSKGVKKFVSSVTELLSDNNMKSMTQGVQNLKDGVLQVNEGLKAVQGGIAVINANASKLKRTDELDQCVAGLKQMQTMYNQMAEAAGSAEEKTQYTQMAAAVTGAIQYIEGGEQLAAGIDAATNGTADGEGDKDGAGDLAIAIAKLQAATDTKTSDTNLYTGANALLKSTQKMSGYAKQLRDSSSDLLDGNKKIETGITKISKAITKLKEGAKKITDNNKNLTDGADAIIENTDTIQKNGDQLMKNSPTLRKATKSLSGGTQDLASGLSKLVESTEIVSKGIGKLTNGSIDLSDGMKKFDEDAIQKLTDTINELRDSMQELTDRVKGIHNASKEYKSYSGLSKDMDGSVKFIMSTEEVK